MKAQQAAMTKFRGENPLDVSSTMQKDLEHVPVHFDSNTFCVADESNSWRLRDSHVTDITEFRGRAHTYMVDHKEKESASTLDLLSSLRI